MRRARSSAIRSPAATASGGTDRTIAPGSLIEPTGDLSRALAALRAGGLVVVPTETVHGLAADGTNGEAVARVFEVKGRPRFNPLIAHVGSLAMARRLADLDARAGALAEALWPGPLTLVLPMRGECPVHPLATGGLGTLALRWPRGPMATLARELDRPLVAPSANVSGRVSPTRTSHVLSDLAARLDPARDAILDDGAAAAVGLESTIVSLAGPRATLLRPGGAPRQAIEAVLGENLVEPDGTAILAPGMLASHYAPQGTVRLEVATVEPHEFLIGFGSARVPGEPAGTFVLSDTGDLAEAARRLFEALHAANAAGAEAIAVEPIPRDGLGEAIHDRLARAAAPRSS